jgi:hypothetical protein
MSVELKKNDGAKPPVKNKNHLPFPKGNQFWLARTKHGKNKKYQTGEELWNACIEYFQWVEEHPIWEDRPFHYQGFVTHEKIAKMRAMTISGLCLFLGISTETWRKYRTASELAETVAEAENVIFNQKFAGAAADLLNANIIARELNLAEKKEHTGLDGGPLKIIVAQEDADLL